MQRSAWERFKDGPKEGEPPLGYEVRLSLVPGAGYGLFATKQYSPMEEIGIYSGTPLRFDETVSRDSTYFMSKPARIYKGVYSPGFVLDGGHFSNDMRWVNHDADNPNARISHAFSRDVIVIKAIRVISPGEEIFMNYGYDLNQEIVERTAKLSYIEPKCNDKECVVCY